MTIITAVHTCKATIFISDYIMASDNNTKNKIKYKKYIV